MSEAPKTEERRGGFGDRRGGRGGARGGRDGRRGPPGRGGPQKDEWNPVTKLGRLVKHGDINSLEEIYTYSIPIKEGEIVDTLIKKAGQDGEEVKLSDEVMKILSVQKQTTAGQRTRFKAVVAIGDHDGHVGLGIKVAKEVQIAIKGALVCAKLSLIPVRRGFWGNKIGNVHTVPGKVTGKCGSVRAKLIPAPRGTGIVGAPVSKKLLMFAGIDDCYTSTTGHTRTCENFVKAVYAALSKTYQFLTPDLWPKTDNLPSLLARHAHKLEEYAARRHKRQEGDRPRRGRDGDRRGGRGGRGQRRGGDRPDRRERRDAPQQEQATPAAE